MNMHSFEVIVSVARDAATDEQSAIAEASRYLAYADTTDIFGYNGRIFDVNVYDGDEMDWGVGLQFTTTLIDDEREQFMSEMEMLAHVETVEELAFTPSDS